MEKSPAVPSKNEGPLPTLQKDEEALPIGGLWMSGGLKTLAPVRTPARVPSPVRVESKRVSRTSLPEDYAARDWPLRAPVSPLPEINRSPLKVTMESQDETAIKEKKPNVIPRKPAPNAV